MRLRAHPKVIDWPPQPGGTGDATEFPQAESQAVLRVVHAKSVVDHFLPLSCEFKRNLFTYDVQTEDEAFARKLATEFSKHIGETLEQLGDLDIDF